MRQWFQLTVILIYFAGLSALSAPCEAQLPLEKTLSKEELERPGAAAIVDRLRILRRNAELFGPKHPALPSVRAQIATLEVQLSELVGKPSDASRNTFPAPGQKEPVIESDTQISAMPLDSNFHLRVGKKSDWGFPSWSKWPRTVQELSFLERFSSDYQDAYPLLGLKGMVAIGPMPGMGLMWGIEYDPIFDRSYIYQWLDSPQSVQKELYIEIPKRVLSLYYPSSFEKDGAFWMLRESESHASQSKITRARIWQNAEILECTANPAPPYQVNSVSDSPIGSLINRSGNECKIISSQQKAWFFIGAIELTVPDFVPEEDAPIKIMVDANSSVLERKSSSGQIGPRLDSMISYLKGVQQNSESVNLLNRRSILVSTSVGIDTIGQGLIIDSRGRVKTVGNSDFRGMEREKWPPEKISELGWYNSLADGVLNEGFKRYTPEKDHELYDGKKSALELHSVEKNSGVSELVADYWFCIPKVEKDFGEMQVGTVFPDGCILLQTLSSPCPFDSSDEFQMGSKIETRVLVHVNSQWYAFSYKWDSEQSDGVLIRSDEQIEVDTCGRNAPFPYQLMGAMNCFRCHVQGAIEFTPRRIEMFYTQETSEPSPGLDWAWAELPTTNSQNKVQRIGFPPVLVDQYFNPDVVHTQLEADSLTVGNSLDWSWFKRSLLEENVELWLKESCSPNGFFRTEFDAAWAAKEKCTATLISQSGMIFTMAVGYEVTADPKYLEAMNRGIVFLLERFADKKYGGFFYEVDANGTVLNRKKDGYGHASVIYALAKAASVSTNTSYSSEALKCWGVIRRAMFEKRGGLMWNASEQFADLNRRSLSPNLQLFEGLLELYDTTRDPGVYNDALLILDFVMDQLRDSTGCIPEEFSDDWHSPVKHPDGELYVVYGHQVEWAFLISRAVELGFPRRYLEFGDQLLDYSIESGYDPVGGGLFEHDGKKGAWQQAEFLRALLRYRSMHGRKELMDAIVKTQTLIKRDFIDPIHGGWVSPEPMEKEGGRKVASHEVGMYLEGNRIAKRLARLSKDR